MLAQLPEQFAQPDRILVARLCSFLGALQPALDRIEIRERELSVDDLDVVERFDAARDVHDVVVFEATHHVGDRIGLADVRQELVAETLAFRRARNESCDIDELDGGGQDASAA